MTAKMFRVCTMVIAIGLALAVSWSVTTGNALVPVLAIVVAIGVRYFCRRSTKEVMADERTRHINEKASAAAVRILTPALALGALVIILMKNRISADMFLIGSILAYSACVLMLLHLAFYSYYSRKL